MSNATKTFEVYNQLGVFADLKKAGCIFNKYDSQWEVWGHFQGENGRKNGRLAQFENVDDAVDFSRMCQEIL